MYQEYKVWYTDSYNSCTVTTILREIDIECRKIIDTNFKVIRKELHLPKNKY